MTADSQNAINTGMAMTSPGVTSEFGMGCDDSGVMGSTG